MQPAPTVGITRDPTYTRGDLVRELEATVLESYSQLNLDNLEAYTDGIARHRPIVLVGVRPQDTLSGVASGAVSRDPRPLLRQAAAIFSKNLEIRLSRDGTVGWIYDEISYRVDIEGRVASLPIRITAVYVRDLDRWVLVNEHWSYPLGLSDVIADARMGIGVAPSGIAPGGSESTLPQLLAIARRLPQADEEFRRRALVAEEGALLLLPGPTMEFHGSEVAAAPTLGEQFGPGVQIELAEHHIGVARTGSVAWLQGNLRVVTRIHDDPVHIGLRVSHVFEQRPGRGWQVVQTHVSAPVGDRALHKHVLGDAPAAIDETDFPP